MPVKQWDLELRFQPLHRAAEGGLRQVQALRRTGQGPALRKGQKLLQLVNLKHNYHRLAAIVTANPADYKEQYAFQL